MSSTAAGSDAPTYSDYVFDRLRADIVCGALAPQSKLAMKELCQRYAVGTSPLREALHRLVGEGLVEFVGQRGFTVPKLSLEDLEGLTELRAMVEEAAARKAMAAGDDAWEAGIVAAFHRLERQIGRFVSEDEQFIRDYDAVHRQFHMALFAQGNSRRLRELHASLFDQAFRYRKLMHSDPVSPRKVLAEHRRLMELVVARDADAAVAALRQHLNLTHDPARRHLGGTPPGSKKVRP